MSEYTLERQIAAIKLLSETGLFEDGIMESVLETLEAMQRLRKIWDKSEYMNPSEEQTCA